MSTGRMETMEPPESTSGAAGSGSAEPGPRRTRACPSPAPRIPRSPRRTIRPSRRGRRSRGPIRRDPIATRSDEPEDRPEPDAVAPEPEPEPDAGARAEPEPEEVAPPVVAVVVTSGDGPLARGRDRVARRAGLPGAVGARARQRRPRSTRRRGSRRRCRPRSCAGSRRTRGFAAAANEALQAVEGATFLLFCHDDVALDPDAVQRDGRGGVPLERGDRRSEARRLRPPRGAARGRHVGRPLRGPVLGDRAGRDRPGTARRRARRVLRVARGDARARRPVPGARRLRRRRRAPGSDDIDLCWRARLAGARVLVAPASRVRRKQADRARRAPDAPPHARTTRAPRHARRVRVLFKSYSTRRALLGAAERLRAHPRRSARRWRSRGAGGTRSRSSAGWIPARGGVRGDAPRPRARRRRSARSTTATSATSWCGAARGSAASSCSACTRATASPTRRTARGNGWRRRATSCGARRRSWPSPSASCS